ncbi:MAG: PAS domain S-box protein [Magnetococcales bacterium]|nr:PAS domain S-box protein [Magnetococcales bacterium]
MAKDASSPHSEQVDVATQPTQPFTPSQDLVLLVGILVASFIVLGLATFFLWQSWDNSGLGFVLLLILASLLVVITRLIQSAKRQDALVLELRHSKNLLVELVEQRSQALNKAEKVLKELNKTNELLEKLFNNPHLAIAFLDHENNFIRVNHSYAQGCGREVHFFPGKNHFDLYPHPENEAIFRQVVTTGQPYSVTAKPFEFPDHPEWGITYWDWALYPVTHMRNQADALIFVLRDVTKQKRAELALEDKEYFYRSLFENTLNATAHCQIVFENNQPIDFIFIKVNQAFIRQTGLQDVVGRPVTQVIPGIYEQDRNLFEVYGRVVQTGQPERFEILVKSVGMWCDVSVYSPAPMQFVVVFDVINERKNQEKIILEEMVRRQILFERSRNGLCVLQMDGRVSEANSRFVEMLGYSMQEMSHLHIWDWDAKWSREEILDTINCVTPEGTSLITRHRRKDGSIYDVEVSVCRVEWKGIPFLWASHRDITLQLQQEEQLRQAMKMEAIGTLTGGIAHDFNNILGVILGFTELALKRIPKDSQPYADMREVFQAGLRARDLVAQLLTFSRRSEGRISRPLMLDPLIKEVMKFLAAVLPATLEVKCLFKHQGLHILGDPTQVHQILMNLCTNAAQSLEGMPGTLTVTLQQTTLNSNEAELLHLPAGAYATLVVEDSGPGIPEAILPRIFDPFFTTKRVGQGTGLGLSVVHGLVHDAGGAIQVQSTLGQGTTFRVLLPLLEENIPPSTQNSPLEQKRFDLHVLVVDDEIALAEMTKLQLITLGCHAVAANSPEQALSILLETPTFDLVITDLVMPHTTGLGLLYSIRSHFPSLPVVLTSGHTSDTSTLGSASAEFTAFLPKPVLMNDLVNVLESLPKPHWSSETKSLT